MENTGKRGKGCLKRLHEVNERNKIVKTQTLKENIEQVMFQCNMKHCSEALETLVFRDKIYKKL